MVYYKKDVSHVDIDSPVRVFNVDTVEWEDLKLTTLVDQMRFNQIQKSCCSAVQDMLRANLQWAMGNGTNEASGDRCEVMQNARTFPPNLACKWWIPEFVLGTEIARRVGVRFAQPGYLRDMYAAAEEAKAREEEAEDGTDPFNAIVDVQDDVSANAVDVGGLDGAETVVPVPVQTKKRKKRSRKRKTSGPTSRSTTSQKTPIVEGPASSAKLPEDEFLTEQQKRQKAKQDNQNKKESSRLFVTFAQCFYRWLEFGVEFHRLNVYEAMTIAILVGLTAQCAKHFDKSNCKIQDEVMTISKVRLFEADTLDEKQMTVQSNLKSSDSDRNKDVPIRGTAIFYQREADAGYLTRVLCKFQPLRRMQNYWESIPGARKPVDTVQHDGTVVKWWGGFSETIGSMGVMVWKAGKRCVGVSLACACSMNKQATWLASFVMAFLRLDRAVEGGLSLEDAVGIVVCVCWCRSPMVLCCILDMIAQTGKLPDKVVNGGE